MAVVELKKIQMENNYGKDYYEVEVEDYDQLEELVEFPQYYTELDRTRDRRFCTVLVVVLMALAMLCRFGPWPLIGISAVFICIFLVWFRQLRQSIKPPPQNVAEKQEDKLKITRCDKECTKVRLLNNNNFV